MCEVLITILYYKIMHIKPLTSGCITEWHNLGLVLSKLSSVVQHAAIRHFLTTEEFPVDLFS